MTIEVTTTRAISAQIIRHRSFTFQEFSQRYAPVPEIVEVHPRRQDEKNRQASVDDLSEETHQWWRDEVAAHNARTLELYNAALEKGIAKECARMVLPMASMTKLYMTANVRNWIHYVDLRCGNGTQLEHKLIADQCKAILFEQLPVIGKAMGWDADVE